MQTIFYRSSRSSAKLRGREKLAWFSAGLTLTLALSYDVREAMRVWRTYDEVECMKHDMEELTRGQGTIRVSLETVEAQLRTCAVRHGFDRTAVELKRTPRSYVLILDGDKRVECGAIAWRWHVHYTVCPTSSW